MFFVDGHCDTIQVALDENIDLMNEQLSFNLEQAKKNGPMIQMTAVFVNPNYKNSFQRAKNIIEYFEKQMKKYPEEVLQVKTKEDILKVEKENKIGCLLTIENGSAIEEKIDNVDYFYNKGVRVMSITWNEDNLLGCGSQTKRDNGLTKLGEQYIKKLNQKGIMIDVSHSSEKTFWDTAKLTESPIVATHSCCYSLCPHPRNLKDEQIKQIAESGGIIGVCYCTAFLSKTEIAGVKEIARHICHIADLVGVDYVGVGSDFDGLEKEHIPTDLKNIGQIDNLIQELRNIGLHQEEIEKIMGKNWIKKILKTEQLLPYDNN